jgi:hypothetical protein
LHDIVTGHAKCTLFVSQREVAKESRRSKRSFGLNFSSHVLGSKGGSVKNERQSSTHRAPPHKEETKRHRIV